MADEKKFDENACVICSQDDEPLCRVTQVGLPKLIESSELRYQSDLKKHLIAQQNRGATSNVLVHNNCRRDFTNQKRIKTAIDAAAAIDNTCEEVQVERRSGVLDQFIWQRDCLFCGKSAVIDKKHPKRNKVCEVTQLEFKDRVLKQSIFANNTVVHSSVQNCIDLVAADARYHKNCMSLFFLEESSIDKKPRRPKHEAKNDAFEQLCVWLDNETELYTVAELHEKMGQWAGGEERYSQKWLKTQLEKRYGESLYFVNSVGKSDIVAFKDQASSILSDKWYENRQEHMQDEAKRVITAAAKLIKNEIRSKVVSKMEAYPSKREIANPCECLPPSLDHLMKLLLPSEIKQGSSGQCILKALKPNSTLPPLLFGLAVEVDHVIGSKWLINELSRLGFCLSYSEVQRYKQSVLVDKDASNFPVQTGSFTQWVADNVDHNVATIDGKGTFHGMGIILCSIKDGCFPDHRIKRITRILSKSEIPKGRMVNIHWYHQPNILAMSKMKFVPLKHLKFPLTLADQLNIDVLWQSASLVRRNIMDIPRPNWSGFMHTFSSGKTHPPPSAVTMLPIIYLNPGDLSCIYSTLLYVQDQAEKMGVNTACITFDQPLWAKAMEIVASKAMPVVVRLGGFHCLMSFLGSVGTLMQGSGLETLLETIYGKNTVTHILSGKAISRALRRHILVDAALHAKLVESLDHSASESLADMFDIPRLSPQEKTEVEELYTKVLSADDCTEVVEESVALSKMKEAIDSLKSKLSDYSRTARFWINYLDYIGIAKMFIRAERTGNWMDHLAATERMLNLFAATGHIHYAKSARLYLQKMLRLDEEYPWLHEQFLKNGFHVVRRTDQYWGSLWSDLVIEQTMMRSIKSQGGLTRGRGMSESVRTLWTSTLHHCASVHETMSSITNTVRRSSEQHKELGTARCTRDASDLRVLCDWLQRFDPFDIGDQRLRSLSSGLAASDNDMINCDDAESVGQAIHQKLDNVAVSKASIPSSMTVKSLVKLSKAIHVHNEAVHIDPTVLFMRLVVLVERYEDTSRFFHYELTPVPTSLFKDGLMRHPNKAALAQALTSGQERGTKRKRNTSNEDVDTNEMAEEDITESEKSSYVLDGGALLHRVRWNSTTFREVLQQYQRYVASRYGKCLIVFDGYQERTIKDHEHLRRQQKGQHCPDIVVTENTEVHHSREEFLSNECNKQQLITLVVKCLKEDGHTVEQCQGDADGTIVDAALGIARSGRQVTVVADDTDVLVLLLYFYSSEMATVFMRSEPKGQQNVKLVNIGRIADTLKADVRQNLLFIHAWTGCDTTSATFNQGKTSIMRLLEQGKRSVLEVCAVFDDSDATQEQIVVAGTKLFVIMYGGRDRDSLGHLRRVKFTEMSLKSRKGLQPEMLPPTNGAAKQHSLRVLLQVTLWKTLMSSTIDPTKWGWNVGKDGSLEPIMTEEDPAPEEILNVVRCKCKNASKNQCGNALCSCRKNGLSCVSACGECNGVGCNNGFNDVVASEEEEDFDAIDDGNIFDKLFCCSI